MPKSINHLFLLLRLGLGTSIRDNNLKLALLSEDVDWGNIYNIAQNQGVLAIAWDGVAQLLSQNSIEQLQIPRNLKIKWAINADIISQRYNKQWDIATELACKYNNNGLQTAVLKGFAVSQLYPIPSHRPCGDLDCFLMGQYERGNILAEQYGAKVERDFYVHSHITYKGLVVENHQYCTPIRGNSRAKRFERRLQNLLFSEPPIPINDSHLLSPSPLFTAIFLAAHARRHFVTEGIALRHLTDWAMLLKQYADSIDWGKFSEIVSIYDKRLLDFAECMTRLSTRYFNTPYIKLSANLNEGIVDMTMNDILSGHATINSNNYNVWHKRWLIISNYICNNWKSRNFGEGSLVKSIWSLVYGFISEKNPKL